MIFSFRHIGCSLLFVLLMACNAKDGDKETGENEQKPDTARIEDKKPEAPVEKTYSNERFRNVIVEKTGENKYRLKGQAQIFEATFSWVVEDGHNEIKEGFQMTDAGAPEWGNFDFTIEVEKKDPNLKLHIILFEVSAKDGSREYELPIPLD